MGSQLAGGLLRWAAGTVLAVATVDGARRLA
jgi:hypothetical protein